MIGPKRFRMKDKCRALFAIDVAVWMVQVDEATGFAQAQGGAIIQLVVYSYAEFEW